MKRVLIPLLMAPTAAFAHPGDHGQESFFHVLTEPDHLALLVGVFGVAVFVAVKLWARR